MQICQSRPPPTHTHTHNPLLVKEKVPTFVRIPGIDGASRVTCTVRGPGHHARMLAAAAAGFRIKSFKLSGVRRKIQRSAVLMSRDACYVPSLYCKLTVYCMCYILILILNCLYSKIQQLVGFCLHFAAHCEEVMDINHTV